MLMMMLLLLWLIMLILQGRAVGRAIPALRRRPDTARLGLGRGVLLGPGPGGRDGLVLVLLPGLGDVGGQRVVRVGRAQERLDR